MAYYITSHFNFEYYFETQVIALEGNHTLATKFDFRVFVWVKRVASLVEWSELTIIFNSSLKIINIMEMVA